jgi:hypothetical protein
MAISTRSRAGVGDRKRQALDLAYSRLSIALDGLPERERERIAFNLAEIYGDMVELCEVMDGVIRTGRITAAELGLFAQHTSAHWPYHQREFIKAWRKLDAKSLSRDLASGRNQPHKSSGATRRRQRVQQRPTVEAPSRIKRPRHTGLKRPK